jgi:hypothetical protein
MLVTLQFPLADLRPFVPGNTRRLTIPSWPSPKADVHFMRQFGAVRDRFFGGVREWPGEHIFCDASHAVRFDAAFSLGSSLGLTRRYCAFRRFFSDGEGASRVEVGVGFRWMHEWTLKELLALVHDTLSLMVTIGRVANAPKTDLFKADRLLARLVLHASTSAKAEPGFDHKPWWVTPCKPTLLIEYDAERDFFGMPPGFTVVNDETTFGLDLSYGRMKFFGRSVGVWLLGTNKQISPENQRLFRIHLLRLHAQREVVMEVLRAISMKNLEVVKTAPSDPPAHPSNVLQRFLRTTIERMERKQYGGVPQSELLRAAEQIQDLVTEGERTTILDQIKPLRKVVFSAVERVTEGKTTSGTIIVVEEGGTYVEQNLTLTGNNNVVNQVIAKTIENSFNRVEKAEISEELKKRLDAVNTLAKELIPKLPQEEQEQTAENLDMFTKQATSKKPNKAWYEVSATGLIEAAKTVAEMATPVITAVKAVLALLA